MNTFLVLNPSFLTCLSLCALSASVANLFLILSRNCFQKIRASCENSRHSFCFLSVFSSPTTARYLVVSRQGFATLLDRRYTAHLKLSPAHEVVLVE